MKAKNGINSVRSKLQNESQEIKQIIYSKIKNIGSNPKFNGKSVNFEDGKIKLTREDGTEIFLDIDVGNNYCNLFRSKLYFVPCQKISFYDFISIKGTKHSVYLPESKSFISKFKISYGPISFENDVVSIKSEI